MRILPRSAVDLLLSPMGLKIGNWNELTRVAGAESYKTYRPSPDALELYAFAQRLLTWLSPIGWTLFQIDNSTSPADDEVNIFERLVLAERKWDIDNQRSFIFDDTPEKKLLGDRTALVLVTFFSLLFEWHVHLVCENSRERKRIALQDGIVHFFGDKDAIDGAVLLIQQSMKTPLRTNQ